MPPRATLPRSVQLPSPSPNTLKSSWKPPKPHLAAYQYQHQYHPPASSSSTSTHFVPPTSPQLPSRRKPAFNPGGFGLQSSPRPAPSPRSWKGKQKEEEIEEIRRKDEEIRRDEERLEGREASKGKEEAEACYVPPPATLHFHSPNTLPLLYSPQPLPPFQIAYETWGTLNSARDNAILLHTGLSASSHVASGGNDVSSSTSSKPGWWEDFVGPGKSIDTDKFFVICTNALGGCFGSTGPSSPYPPGDGETRWATRFPMLSIHDMTRAQLDLLDHLKIDKLYASIGSSMGGMQSISMAYIAPERVGRVASISASGRSGLNGVGMRYAQRSVLMADPNWNRGFYYDGVPPHNGMKLARQIATITYRSGPEWEQRFGRQMLSEQEAALDSDGNPGVPRLSPDFLIETYLDHQGERFCLTYDANSMIYLSKAMDLFDMSSAALTSLARKFNTAYPDANPFPYPSDPVGVSVSSPRPENTSQEKDNSNVNEDVSEREKETLKKLKKFIPTSKSPHLSELSQGLKRLKDIPALVLGVQSDVLFPVEQQRELADALKLTGNQNVTYYELGGVWGHDTFLLDVQNVGGAIRGFLH
ncbi:homoserine O-acetyltransferase [Kwoniella dejecticola CBS 10117]|uniref:Homoserine O-acetyltransferase n=1 Tax=Kwoniella dejecticola CBS 10117 TaxID=1296121 RepID=A0A1A5ZXG5_9TREE|nr:homoserine O-acetyltransferase [Kwoniella dejecticola CBS 10117]OBR82498.1 homoserine O-acetyltransferase [Kwoniella dejecticola CBS 10117]